MGSEMISCEYVKPSSPTPPHQQTYKFSMFDQTSTSSYIPLVLYFANTVTSTSHDTTNHQHLVSRKTEQLRTSLSLTLTRFYPVAGRVGADCQSVDCGDQGVPFSVVNVKGHRLSDLLKPYPDRALWAQLLPCPLTSDAEWEAGSNVVMIKVTHFECGGVAIAAIFWHKVIDAVTMTNFLKYWSATTRGLPSTKLVPEPNYILPSLFPAREQLENSAGPAAELIVKEKFVTRLYVFDGPAVRRLKAESSTALHSPTRVEVVTALLWKAYMAASLANQQKASAIIHVVNLRKRARPPLPSECFGNMTNIAIASYSNTNYDHTVNDPGDDILQQLVKEIRDATSKIDDEYVNKMRGDQGHLGLFENQKLIGSRVPAGGDCLCFSSWCGMGFYDLDFGYGNPIWMTITDGSEKTYAFRNTVLLVDTKLGDGVEAWVILKEEYMKVLENVAELKKYASPR